MKIKNVLKLFGLGAIGIGILLLRQYKNQSEKDDCEVGDTSEQQREESQEDKSLPSESSSDELLKETFTEAKCNVASSIRERHQEAGEIMRESLQKIFNDENSCDNSACDNSNEDKFDKINSLLNEEEREI